jgi:hypothetical protein
MRQLSSAVNLRKVAARIHPHSTAFYLNGYKFVRQQKRDAHHINFHRR